MEKSFLNIVARDLICKYGNNLSNITIVFPNKRAALFLNKELASLSNIPILAPQYSTIDQLIASQTNLTVADDIKLICELYNSYKKCTGSDDKLDDFFGWGQMLLADFNDIDKNMADAKMVLSNTANVHEFDSVDFLTQQQKNSLQQFFSNFTEHHNTKLKLRFLSFWNHLYDIYTDFYYQLNKQGITTNGALYRTVASSEHIVFDNRLYLFVGFNFITKSEKVIFKRLCNANKARFYWDYDYAYLNNESEAGKYILANMQLFTNELDNDYHACFDNFNCSKKITFLSSPTENAQARYASQWLETVPTQHFADTAIVMCNEDLLLPLTHCLPLDAGNVNITSGYPLCQTPIASLISLLFAFQTLGKTSTPNQYRLKYVNPILKHPYCSMLSDNFSLLYKRLNLNKTFFPQADQLCVDEQTTLLFSEVSTTESSVFNKWLINIINAIATKGKERLDDDDFFQESIFRTYKILARLQSLFLSNDLNISIATYQGLLSQIINSTSVPFHGEPIKGLQIMGVLETRNLDFKNLLILSCNEGNMPRNINDTSLIPYSIRRAFNLTTIENKTAIYAYHFFRLLARADNITIAYNNSNGGGKMNEMSRFMLQLMVESNHDIQLNHIATQLNAKHRHIGEIAKSDDIVSALNSIETLYPTDINTYLRCQKRFYFSKIAKLKEKTADDGTIDNRIFGNIFHKASEIIYRNKIGIDNNISQSCIEQILNNKHIVLQSVDEAFNQEQIGKPHGGMHLISRQVIASYLVRLLQCDLQLAPFKIIGLEKTTHIGIDIETTIGPRKLDIGGIIDRLDQVSNKGYATIRVVDYKTGNRTQGAMGQVADIFCPNNVESHSDYYLQTMLYAIAIRHNQELNPLNLQVSPALLFIQHSSHTENPTLKINKQPIDDILSYETEFINMLRNLISEIYNPSVGFSPTENRNRCNTCPFAQICINY